MEWAAKGEFQGQGSIRCYLFILCSEVRPVQLVDGHHDGNHVFTVHDGDGDDVLGLILSQLIHKVTEMRALWEEKKREYLIVYNCLFFGPVPLKTSRLNFDEHTTSIHKCCNQRLPIIWKLKSLSAALHLLLLLCSRSHQLCSARGEKQKERLINCQEGTKTCRERCLGDWSWWQSADLGEAGWDFLFRWYFLLQKEDWEENYTYSHMYILHTERQWHQPTQACESWPIRAHWDLWEGGFKETDTKMELINSG